jgi:transposase-like protein
LCCCNLEGFVLSESRDAVAWIEELCPEIGKRRVGGVAGSVPKSLAVKRAAVIELCAREESARVVAQKTGVSRPMLYSWKNQLLGRELPASMKCQKKPAPDHERGELERQVESLRRDIRKLQLEHDILEKANELAKKGMGIDPQLLSNRESLGIAA